MRMCLNFSLCIVVAYLGNVNSSSSLRARTTQGKSSTPKTKIPKELAKLVHIAKYGETPKQKYYAVVKIRKEFGPKALPAFPELFEMLSLEVVGYNPKTSAKHRFHLGQILNETIAAMGPDVGPKLVDIAKNTRSTHYRATAMRAVGLYRYVNGMKLDKQIWPLIKKHMKDSSALVRKETIYASGYYSDKVEEIWPTILAGLKDTELTMPKGDTVGYWAAGAVRATAFRGQLKLAKSAMPYMFKELDSRDKNIQRIVVDYLSALAWKDPSMQTKIYSILIDIFKRRDPLRGVVLGGLTRFDATSKKNFPLFLNTLKDRAKSSVGTRCAILVRFRRLGSKAAPAVPTIVAVLNISKDVYERECAIRALRSIGPGVAARLATPILKKIADNDPNINNSTRARRLLDDWRRATR